jgi:Xaa-Pro dipeptidase
MTFTEFEIAEYERRLENAHRLMRERNIDALFVCTQANFRYFTGHVTHRWLNNFTPLFSVIPRADRPILLVPAIEMGMANASPWIKDARPIYGYVNIGIKEITDTIRDLTRGAAVLGAELGTIFHMGMPLADFTTLQRELPQVRFVDASDVFWKLRIPKSAAELRYLRRAVTITDQAYRETFARVKPGMTEREIHQTVVRSLMAHGADAPGSIPVGSRSPGETLPWDVSLRRPTNRRIAEGDLVFMDGGCVVNGYWSDFTRMFCVGKARPEWKAAYRFVYDSLHECIREIKPGAPISNQIARYRDRLRASPYSHLAEKLGRIGHGCGLELTEPPSISFVDTTILEPGTVLTVEPSISVKEGFFMLEEDVLVTETGYEVLSDPAPAELPELG